MRPRNWHTLSSHLLMLLLHWCRQLLLIWILLLPLWRGNGQLLLLSQEFLSWCWIASLLRERRRCLSECSNMNHQLFRRVLLIMTVVQIGRRLFESIIQSLLLCRLRHIINKMFGHQRWTPFFLVYCSWRRNLSARVYWLTRRVDYWFCHWVFNPWRLRSMWIQRVCCWSIMR